MLDSRFFSRTLFALALATVLAVAGHSILPEKHFDWLPDPDRVAHVYADDMHGGASTAHWVNESAHHFRCVLRESELPSPPFCGIHVHFDTPSEPTVDLSRYRRAYIDVDYNGDNEKLRIYLTEFVPGFTNPDEPVMSGTAKYLSAYVPSAETDEQFVVQMGEFLVADWWVNNNNVPREFSTASRNNVLTFGIDIAYPSALGEHDLKINRVTFVGDWVSAEQWYLGILVIWVIALIAVGLGRIIYLRQTLQKEQQEKAKYQELSSHDALTGLMNRPGLMNDYHRRIDNDESCWPVTVMVIDIDHFKPVNDTYGHSVGDLILQRVAHRILTHTRETDIAARWGGEEFVVVLPYTSGKSALALAERLRQSVMTAMHPEAGGQSVTISIGVCQVEPGQRFEDAFKRADAALYRAKSEGRNCIVVEEETS
ncbi:GGDEF domain-containing protein [Marinimicrobium sp. C2-29]|uniref:GGDEF domain-containing protein n=1 Tax=Marinimicrobium sp. C2-29 TaxID=3139825 RepID=UPI00313A4CA2